MFSCLFLFPQEPLAYLCKTSSMLQYGKHVSGPLAEGFSFYRHLFLWTRYLTGWKLFLFLPQNIKRGVITKQRVGLEWLSLNLCCIALPFLVGQKILPGFPGRTHKWWWCFTLKYFQPMRYWNATQFWLNPEEKGRQIQNKVRNRLESPFKTPE